MNLIKSRRAEPQPEAAAPAMTTSATAPRIRLGDPLHLFSPQTKEPRDRCGLVFALRTMDAADGLHVLAADLGGAARWRVYDAAPKLGHSSGLANPGDRNSKMIQPSVHRREHCPLGL